jgi:hypothetical protein
MMDLGRLLFEFYGFYGGHMDFYDKRDERHLMQRFDFFGNSVFAQATLEDIRTEPAEGSRIHCVGEIKVSKKQGLSLQPHVVHAEGRDKDYQFPNNFEELVLKGCFFQGQSLVAKKDVTTFEGQLYRSVTFPLIGGSYKFSSLSESLFDRFPDRGMAIVSGNVSAVIRNTDTGKQVVNTLDLQNVQTPQAATPAPKQPQSKAA